MQKDGFVDSSFIIPTSSLPPEALLPHLPAELVKRWYKLDESIVCPRPDGTGPDKGRARAALPGGRWKLGR